MGKQWVEKKRKSHKPASHVQARKYYQRKKKWYFVPTTVSDSARARCVCMLAKCSDWLKMVGTTKSRRVKDSTQCCECVFLSPRNSYYLMKYFLHFFLKKIFNFLSLYKFLVMLRISGKTSKSYLAAFFRQYSILALFNTIFTTVNIFEYIFVLSCSTTPRHKIRDQHIEQIRLRTITFQKIATQVRLQLQTYYIQALTAFRMERTFTDFTKALICILNYSWIFH